MKFKLDENIGRRGVELFLAAGYDTATVQDQNLCSSPDAQLIEICRLESRCLVTLDLEFANPLVYDPLHYLGIALLRLPPNPTIHHFHDVIRTLLAHVANNDVTHRLWIVEV